MIKFHIYRVFDSAIKEKGLSQILNFGDSLTNDILGEILCSNCSLLNEIDLHDKGHKIKLMKRLIFSFISIKGKHLCRTQNKEENSLIRHSKTKEIIFNQE